jgi:hypothetical protein
MKYFTVTKLDRRHKGYSQFGYYITPVWSSTLADKLKYFEWRNWCHVTWGAGIEREEIITWGKDYPHDLRWAWHNQDGNKRLYFATEKELNWFVLTWSA